jgi:hypothetical protein
MKGDETKMTPLTEPTNIHEYRRKSLEDRAVCGLTLLHLNEDYFQKRFLETGAKALLYAGSEEVKGYDSWEDLLDDWSRAELRILNQGKVPYRIFQQVIVTDQELIC